MTRAEESHRQEGNVHRPNQTVILYLLSEDATIEDGWTKQFNKLHSVRTRHQVEVVLHEVTEPPGRARGRLAGRGHDGSKRSLHLCSLADFGRWHFLREMKKAKKKKITLAHYLLLGTFPRELQTSRSLAMANFTFSRAAKRKLSIDQTRNKPATDRPSFAEK